MNLGVIIIIVNHLIELAISSRAGFKYVLIFEYKKFVYLYLN